MASARYTRNITPDAPEVPIVLTRKQKLENFWYYHKWQILGGAVALLLIFMFVRDIVTKVDPDYQIGMLNTTGLPEDAILALETGLAQFADDRNGDGKVVVTVLQYTMKPASDAADVSGATGPGAESASTAVSAASAAGNAAGTMDIYAQMASTTRLMSDAQNGDSMLFLTDDLEAFQVANEMFAYNDGTTPADGEVVDFSRMGVPWQSCPPLATLALGNITHYDGTTGNSVQSLLADYVLTKRAFDGTAISNKAKLRSYYDSSCALFDTLTARA